MKKTVLLFATSLVFGYSTLQAQSTENTTIKIGTVIEKDPGTQVWNYTASSAIKGNPGTQVWNYAIKDESGKLLRTLPSNLDLPVGAQVVFKLGTNGGGVVDRGTLLALDSK